MERFNPSFRESLIIPLWSITVMLVVMNTTMFNVALPTVAQALHLTATSASWIVTGYSILFAISSITYSRLSDFIPIRTLLTLGLLLLGGASIVGMLATNYYMLMAARLLQAVGAASAPGLGIVLVTRYIPVERRGRSMSGIVSAASFGFGFGPIVGGILTQYIGYSSLFAVTALVLLALPVFLRHLPKQAAAPVRFDGWGALFIGVGVTGLLLYLTGHQWLPLALGLAALFAFWVRIQRVEHAFVQPALLRKPKYMSLIAISFVSYVLHFSTLFLMPVILTHLFGKSSSVTGLLIFPGAILTALLSPQIGRWIDRLGNAPVMVSAHVLLLLSAAGFALLSTQSAYFIGAAYLFMSVSVSAIGSSVSNEMSRILDKSEIGGGMGLSQLAQFFGGALGVALTSASLVWQAARPLEAAYAAIFWVMLAGAVLSLLLSVQYVRAGRRKPAAAPLAASE
ncbi:MFS transporter [Paenibacillus sp. tmac-D7]|uniref:MFS transporter n=1 Tax=Paenibacillus sp. tmac-D7 TaxID=2591462 RepID=UPI001142BEA2|nr:MFS transporter [Paenibacillus sp. tmac-D7]